MNIKKSITDLIGKTPLLELGGIEERMNLDAQLVAKLESFNPLGSVKDRTAYAMILAAEEDGRLTPDTVVVEPTSGNTGIGLAFVCAVRGYKLILTMPEGLSAERCGLLEALGAELVLTPIEKGIPGAIETAESIARTLPYSFMPMQFENPSNPEVHRLTTGPEIWEDTDGQVDVLVGTIGTGGTITGAGQFLKEKNPNIKLVGVEPAGSPVVSGGTAGFHKLQGIGAGFIPEILDVKLLDEMVTVSDEDALEMTRRLAAVEGLLVGISSGAAVQAAVDLCRRQDCRGKMVVVILPDTGDRYLSTGAFRRYPKR